MGNPQMTPICADFKIKRKLEREFGDCKDIAVEKIDFSRRAGQEKA